MLHRRPCLCPKRTSMDNKKKRHLVPLKSLVWASAGYWEGTRSLQIWDRVHCTVVDELKYCMHCRGSHSCTIVDFYSVLELQRWQILRVKQSWMEDKHRCWVSQQETWRQTWPGKSLKFFNHQRENDDNVEDGILMIERTRSAGAGLLLLTI